MKQIMTKLFSRVAVIAAFATVFAGNAAAQTKTDIMFAKGFGGYASNSYSAKGTDYTAVANSTNATGVTYAMQVFNGSTGAVRGNKTGAENFSCRNTTTYEDYYISSVSLTVSGGTLDGSTAGRSVAYFGSTAFANPNTSAPSGNAVSASPAAAGKATLTWTNSDQTASYFVLYNLKTANTALSANASTALTVVWTKKSSGVPCAAPTFSPAAGGYTSAQNVTISTTTEGATIYYTTNGNDPTTSSSVYSAPIAVSSNMTIKAMAAKSGYNNSSVSSASYTIVNLDHAGTQADPYSVSDARTAIDNNIGIQGVYATGIVSAIPTEYSTQFSNITFNFVDAEGDTNFLQAYRCKGTSTADASDVRVGDIVVVKGNLTKFGTTYEFAEACELVSLTHPAGSVESPTFSPAAGTYTTAQNVAISCATAGATIYYTTDGTDPTSASTPYSAPINVSSYTTIKAIAIKGTSESTVTTASYHFCSQDDPYTVTQALAFNTYPANGIYVQGIVSTAPTMAPTNNGEMTYYISADGTAENQLEVYKGLGLDEAAFTSKDDIQVGDIVTVFGNVQVFQSTIEFGTGNYLVSFERPTSGDPSITVSANAINATAAAKEGTITVTCENMGAAPELEVLFFQSDGTTSATYDWLTAEINSDNNVAYSISANNGAARTAYFKVYGLDGSANDVYSELITVSQAAYVPDFAELPFEFDGGKSDIASTAGLTQSGLGSDYSSAPKLKFDGTGDELVLKFNERPGKLTFFIKGNSFSGGTFTVQASADGTTYTDLKEYTELGETDIETFNNLNENVRFIKWVYTEKVNGNVALGNITLAKYADLASYTVSWTEGEHTSLFVFGGDESETIDNGSSVPEGTLVEISVDVDAGYELGSLTVKDAEDHEIELTTIEPGVFFSFEMPASNVTITSTAVAATGDRFALFSGNLEEGDYIIYYNGYAMKNTVKSDRLEYELVTPASGVISTDNAAIIWHIAPSGDYWTIYSADADAYAAGTGVKNKAQLLADGTDDKALWTVTGTETYEFVNKANAAAEVNSTLRNNGTNGFACYSASTGGALSLYKYVAPATPDTIDLTLTLGDGGYWGTFYNSGAIYELPEGAQAFTMSSNSLHLLGDDGRLIPEDLAVVIVADKANITLTKIEYAEQILIFGGPNELRGSDTPVPANGKQFVLGKKDGVIGFYKFAGESIPAGKAYYISE